MFFGLPDWVIWLVIVLILVFVGLNAIISWWANLARSGALTNQPDEFKITEPNLNLRIKKYLIDSAIKAKPPIVQRISFMGDLETDPPAPQKCLGFSDGPDMSIACIRGRRLEKIPLLIPRRYHTPATSPDIIIRGTNYIIMDGYYAKPRVIHPDGRPATKAEKLQLDLEINNFLSAIARNVDLTTTTALRHMQTAEAATGNAERAFRAHLGGSGQPDAIPQSETGEGYKGV